MNNQNSRVMTREQIEKKAKEMENKYPEVGYNSKYHREIYSAAMEMAEWLLFNQWVSVEDELPKDKQNVFITLASGRSTCGWYSHTIEEWFISVGEIGGDDCLYEHVTHWMPIPPLAEEGCEK